MTGHGEPRRSAKWPVGLERVHMPPAPDEDIPIITLDSPPGRVVLVVGVGAGAEITRTAPEGWLRARVEDIRPGSAI
jgi:hypothetical protein